MGHEDASGTLPLTASAVVSDGTRNFIAADRLWPAASASTSRALGPADRLDSVKWVLLNDRVTKIMPRISERMRRIQAMREEFIAAERLLSIDEVARILKRSRYHVVTLLDTGGLPFIPSGTHRKIRPADLEEFLKQARRVESTEVDPKLYHRHGRRPAIIRSLPADSCIKDVDIQDLFR